MTAPATDGVVRVVQRPDIGKLWTWLAAEGYTVVGPTVREGAIVYDELRGVDDLPIGWTDEQDGGRYRLKRRDDEALFGYAVGPHSWKKYLFPPRRRLWRAERRGAEVVFRSEPIEPRRYAFLGVRSCELHAIAIQDRVFLGEQFPDPYYAAHRESIFTIAVNCHTAGGTCFCVSMNTGPRCTAGYDVVLTELIGGGRHELVLESGTERGTRLVQSLPGRETTQADEAAIDYVIRNTAAHMGRTHNNTGIVELLTRNYEHPRWADVTNRCLTCGNCTQACPTCFCSTVEDATDVSGDHAERARRWDSCFSVEHSYLHGGAVRQAPLPRYRQWMTHKLATWYEQFGTSGCVGCGRCITWCPVGIDITEEVKAIRGSDHAD
jgi:ferredoxin